MGQTSLWVCNVKPDAVFLPRWSVSRELGFVTSENTKPGFCLPERTYPGLHLVAVQTGWDSKRESHNPCSLSTQASSPKSVTGVTVHTGPLSSPPPLLRWYWKSPTRSPCLASQAGGSKMGGIARPRERPEALFSLLHSHGHDNGGLCLLRPTLGGDPPVLGRVFSFLPSCEMPLG